jgi:hypothetical protein
MGFDRVKPLRQRQHSRQPGTLDRKARFRRDITRILKCMLDKTVAARLERHDIRHRPIPFPSNANDHRRVVRRRGENSGAARDPTLIIESIRIRGVFHAAAAGAASAVGGDENPRDSDEIALRVTGIGLSR